MTSPRRDNIGLVQLLLILMTSLSDVVVSIPANHQYSGIVADDLHIEYHPSASLVGHGNNIAAAAVNGDGHGATTGLGTYHGSYISDWSSDWSIPAGTVGGRLNVARCVDIPSNMSLCRNIGYDQMRLPNLLDHDTLAETTHQASSWVPLLNIRCHPDTQMFLCSLFAPVCLDRPIYPCQTLCKAVKTGCEARMLKYGFPWPEMLNCDKFPLDNDLCIGSQSGDQQQAAQTDETVCSVCSQPDTFENIVDNFCQSEFVMRIRLSQSAIDGDDIRLTANKRKQLKKTVDKKKLKGHQLQFFIENGAYCQCNGIALSSQTQAPRRNAAVGQATGSGSATPMLNTGSYLVMGSRRADRLVLSFIQPLDKQSTGQTRALNAMKQENICKSIIVTGSPNRKQGSRGRGDGAKKSSDSANLGGKGSKLKPSRQQSTTSSVSTTTPTSSTTTTKATTTLPTTTTTVLVTTTRQLPVSGVSTAGNKRKYGSGGGGTRKSAGSRQNIINGKLDPGSSSTGAVTGDQRRAVPTDQRKAQLGLADVTTASGQQRQQQQQRSGGKTKGNAATAAVNERSAA